MSFVAEQRPLSNLLLLHVWDSLLLNPNYTILLCLIISALAGIKTEAHFPVRCTTLLFRVSILQSGAAPTQDGGPRGYRDGRKVGWDPGLFFLSCACVLSSGLCIVPSSPGQLRKSSSSH